MSKLETSFHLLYPPRMWQSIWLPVGPELTPLYQQVVWDRGTGFFCGRPHSPRLV